MEQAGIDFNRTKTPIYASIKYYEETGRVVLQLDRIDIP